MLESLFSSTTTATVDVVALLVCVVASLVLGVAISLAYCFRTRHTASFATSLTLLPAIVCVVIALVNGNVGAGVAVMGAFSLVRFRSAAGDARQIAFVFLAMCVGLAAGMGYVSLAITVTVVVGGASMALQLACGQDRGDDGYRTVRVTVPEELDFTDAFDATLARHTSEHRLTAVRTSGMGTLYKLTYDVRLRPETSERALIDELRCLNGNLEVIVSSGAVVIDEL